MKKCDKWSIQLVRHNSTQVEESDDKHGICHMATYERFIAAVDRAQLCKHHSIFTAL